MILLRGFRAIRERCISIVQSRWLCFRSLRTNSSVTSTTSVTSVIRHASLTGQSKTRSDLTLAFLLYITHRMLHCHTADDDATIDFCSCSQLLCLLHEGGYVLLAVCVSVCQCVCAVYKLAQSVRFCWWSRSPCLIFASILPHNAFSVVYVYICSLLSFTRWQQYMLTEWRRHLVFTTRCMSVCLWRWCTVGVCAGLGQK